MRALPVGIDSELLVRTLADGWGLVVQSLRYAPVGAGSYHWVATEPDGRRWFVTVDDLNTKLWLGTEPKDVCAGLGSAFDVALALKESDLDFVVAPLRTVHGESLVRLGAAHTVALFPYVDGEPGHFGQFTDPARAATLAMLTALHQVDVGLVPSASRMGLSLPERVHLDAALREHKDAWAGGPLSEPAREALAQHAGNLVTLLDRADQLANRLADRNLRAVVTHGEPHAANVLLHEGQSWLVDWDTVAVAPPERDLWMVVLGAPDAADAYALSTGYRPDPDALAYFRLLWDLKDIAAFIRTLRAPHHDDEDTRKALHGLLQCLTA